MTRPSTLTPLITPEPGNRFELAAADGRLVLPELLGVEPLAPEVVEDPSGQPLAVRWQPENRSLTVADHPSLGLSPDATPWLEFKAPNHFRLIVDPARPQPAAEATTEQGVRITFDPQDLALLSGPDTGLARLDEFDLASRAARLATHAGFDQLICLPLVRDMELLEHQIRTAKTVLQRFRGRALLCDEVGLGKTIEAGLIFAELRMRGLIRSALVLVPPSLIEQWQGEMRRKFGLDLISHDDPRFRAARHGRLERVRPGHRLACTPPSASRTARPSCARKWDLVIVDEAHHLRNRNTQLWRFASELQKQYILLLTATPVQNNLEELFNLVTCWSRACCARPGSSSGSSSIARTS